MRAKICVLATSVLIDRNKKDIIALQAARPASKVNKVLLGRSSKLDRKLRDKVFPHFGLETYAVMLLAENCFEVFTWDVPDHGATVEATLSGVIPCIQKADRLVEDTIFLIRRDRTAFYHR